MKISDPLGKVYTHTMFKKRNSSYDMNTAKDDVKYNNSSSNRRRRNKHGGEDEQELDESVSEIEVDHDVEDDEEESVSEQSEEDVSEQSEDSLSTKSSRVQHQGGHQGHYGGRRSSRGGNSRPQSRSRSRSRMVMVRKSDTSGNRLSIRCPGSVRNRAQYASNGFCNDST